MRPTHSVLAFVLACAGTAALAHHGFSGRYDRSTPLWIEGVVTDASFGFPHSTLVLDTGAGALPVDLPESAVEFADGLAILPEAGEVAVEFPPVGRFNGLEDRVGVGDRIQLVVLRNCEPPHQLRVQWIAPATGEPVVREGRMQEEVAAC